MSEETTYPQMPKWENLLSPELLLIYVAQHMGECTLDTTNRTVTMNATYTYEEGWAQSWLNIVEQFESDYLANCTNGEGAENDLQLFKEFKTLIQELQQKGV